MVCQSSYFIPISTMALNSSQWLARSPLLALYVITLASSLAIWRGTWKSILRGLMQTTKRTRSLMIKNLKLKIFSQGPPMGRPAKACPNLGSGRLRGDSIRSFAKNKNITVNCLQNKHQQPFFFQHHDMIYSEDSIQTTEIIQLNVHQNHHHASLWARQYLGDSVRMIEIIQSNKCTSKSPASNSQLWARQYLGDSTDSKLGLAIKSGQASLHITLINKLIYFSEMI